MFSHFIGWVATGSSALLFSKYIGRKSKKPAFNRALSKTHKPLAALMIGAGLVHGMATLFDHTPTRPAAFISGVALFGSAVGICLTGLHRKNHIKTWMNNHRKLSILMIVLLMLHLLIVL